jgi:hypothetical protein
VQRWHIIEGAVTSLYFTVGAALRFGPVALGVTGNLVRSSVSIRQAKSFNPQQVVDPLNEGASESTSPARTPASHRGDGRSRARALVGSALPIRRSRDWARSRSTARCRPAMGDVVAAPRPVTYTHALPDIVRAGLRARRGGGGARSSCACSAILTALEPPAIAMRVSVRVRRARLPGRNRTRPRDGTTIQNIRRAGKTLRANLGVSYWLTDAIELFAAPGSRRR